MAIVCLFHSVLGLNPFVRAFAGELRAAGHEVHTPDLFDGEVFTSIAEGLPKRDALGIPELARRATEAADALPAGVVYAGFSLGAASAQMLAATRPGAKGAILMHAALPLQAFGIDAWPEGVPLQLHGMEGDEWMDLDVADALAAQAGHGSRSFRYPGHGHLFADPADEGYDPQAAALMMERVKALLRAVDEG